MDNPLQRKCMPGLLHVEQKASRGFATQSVWFQQVAEGDHVNAGRHAGRRIAGLRRGIDTQICVTSSIAGCVARVELLPSDVVVPIEPVYKLSTSDFSGSSRRNGGSARRRFRRSRPSLHRADRCSRSLLENWL